MGYREEEFVLNNMELVISAKEIVDECSQLFFQLERVYFYAFEKNMKETVYYAYESIDKTINTTTLAMFEGAIKRTIRTRGPSEELGVVALATRQLRKSVGKFAPSRGAQYEDIYQTEQQARELSRLLCKLICDTFSRPIIYDLEKEEEWGDDTQPDKNAENQQPDNNTRQ